MERGDYGKYHLKFPFGLFDTLHNKDLQDIKVEFANFMPYPFKQAVVSLLTNSFRKLFLQVCWYIIIPK